LDKETYTIEEFLAETELIQEVKSGNHRLLQLYLLLLPPSLIFTDSLPLRSALLSLAYLEKVLWKN
jgi:hypothetical protein